MNPNQQTQSVAPSNYSDDVWLARHIFTFNVLQCKLSLSSGKLSLIEKDNILFDTPATEISAQLKKAHDDQINFVVNSKKYRLFFKPPSRLKTYTDMAGKKALAWKDILIKAGVKVS